MPKKKIYFMCLLANSDSSILRLKLDHGFKVEAISDKEGLGLISILERLPFMEIGKRLLMDFPCLNYREKKIYFISNSFDSNIELSEKGLLTDIPLELPKFENNLVNNYLKPVMRLMRLFKEGNICAPLKYYFFIENNSPKSFHRGSTGQYVSRDPYRLESSELPDLHMFIQNVKLPFVESFLQLAFENFELSYQTPNLNLSFLSLMVSLETLFNPGGRELRYRISRNAAVLLGKDKESSKKIFSEIKILYDKRSAIIHTGKSNIIDKEDLLKLRHYVRESIKGINKIGKNKNEILDLLNSCGFGERVQINDY